jgi:ABC-type Zn uptake system ZnuABC Zn-binding protein ZnuA/ABC-type Mn2+/Zn2+ transport system permease subunit
MDVLQLDFAQRGLLEVLALAAGAGVLGTWIVLRGLAFYAHAVGTAAFPGLVLADGLGVAASAGAALTAGIVALLVAVLVRRDREGTDSVTALVLVGALALGVVLASDVFESGAGVDALLFGSLFTVEGADVALAAVVSALVVAVALVAGPRWLAVGFDERTARAQGLPAGRADAVLLALVTLLVVASLSAVGALLVTAILVVPAATTRLLCSRLRTWQLATVGLVAVQGVAAVWLSVELDAPPGATLAVLAGATFALVALGRALGGRRLAAAAGAVALAGGVGACGSDDGDGASGGSGGERPRVVAATTHLADIAREVGCDRAEVTGLLEPQSDPHDYEPRPSDVRAVAEADVVLVSGGDLDEWTGEVVRSAGKEDAVLTVFDEVPVRREDDPHWWQDPRNLEAAARQVATRIGGDAGPYLERIAELDRAAARCFAAIPEAERRIVTDHDAFGYLAARYDVEVVGTVIPARTSQAQPSAGDLAELARTIERTGVRAIFPEDALEPRLARALAERTGASADFRLYADALGPEGSPGATVLGAYAHNVRELVRGMTAGEGRCELPA